MRNFKSDNIYNKIEKNQKFPIDKKEIKTTNVNILLNRVRKENMIKKKQKIILSISIISFISFISTLVFGN